MQRDTFLNRSYSNWHSHLVNLTAVFCLLPFIAPLPISTDVQYPVFFLCAFIFMLDVTFFIIKGLSVEPSLHSLK